MVVLLSLASLCAVPLSLPSFFIRLLCRGGCCCWEVSKDEKHLAVVEKVGSDFIPLVVERFGVWTPFALKIIHLIADCTTPRSGDPRKLANLLQQLSVQLVTDE